MSHFAKNHPLANAVFAFFCKLKHTRWKHTLQHGKTAIDLNWDNRLPPTN